MTIATKSHGGFGALFASFCLVAAFALSLVFHGTSVNLAVLAIVVGCLLLAVAGSGVSSIWTEGLHHRIALIWVVAFLAYLIAAYQISISKDSSFAPSWVLAAGPLAFLAAQGVMVNGGAVKLLRWSVCTVIVSLAAVSLIRFLWLGERAHQPLVDPNNYGSIMYLAWIPLAHHALVRFWNNGYERWQLGVWLACFVLLVTLFATRSRGGALIAVVALLVWWLLAVKDRRDLKPVLVQTGIVLSAFLLVWVRGIGAEAGWEGASVVAGTMGVRGELIRSSWSMFSDFPFGLGVFCFPLVYPSYRSPNEQETLGLFVHNDYLQFLIEGGLPMLLLLVFFAVGVGYAFLRSLVHSRGRLAALGYLMALTALCLHATINFVFYSLPLVIVAGVLAASAFGRPLTSADDPAPTSLRAGFFASVALSFLMWSYLALDVAVAGVFQNQKLVPGVAAIRGDGDRMLEFARGAQRLNGSRSIPVLAEAVLMEQRLWGKLGDETPAQVAARYREALRLDPWNTLTYQRFADFVEAYPDIRREDESAESLLMTAVGLDPLFLPAIDGLIARFEASGRSAHAYALLRRIVYPWMPLLRHRDLDASERYFDMLERYATGTGDAEFLEELAARRLELKDVRPIEVTRWWF